MSGILDVFRGEADVLLADHTPNAGGPWAIGAGAAPALDGNGATEWLTSGGIYIAGPLGDVVPQALTPDTVSGPISLLFQIADLAGAGQGEDTLGVIARYTDADHFYALVYIAGAGSVSILKQTLAGQTEPQDFFPATDWSTPEPILWEIDGADHYVRTPDGVDHTWTDPADPYTDPGKVGIGGTGHSNATATSGAHLSELQIVAGLIVPFP